MSAKTYLIRCLWALVLFSVLILGFNAFMDPYAVFGTERIEGLNASKTDINDYVRLAKAYQPLRRDNSVLILGNSRVEMGIDPEHKCFAGKGLVYNLGMPGAVVAEQVAYGLNLIHQQPITELYLGLDFTDFIITRERSLAAEAGVQWPSIGRLRYLADATRNPDFQQARAFDYYRALYSLDALMSSIKTLASQDELSGDRTEAGFNPALDFVKAVRVEGPAALFLQKMHELERSYARAWSLRFSDGSLSPHFAALEYLLVQAGQRDIKVMLFSNPLHAQFWQVAEHNGLLPLHEEWLEILTRFSSSAGAEVRFWDFSSDPRYNQEAVPPLGVKAPPLQWFWEPAHYRKELGDLMVEAMLSESCATPVRFGRQLN